jgi:hypothetical protein
MEMKMAVASKNKDGEWVVSDSLRVNKYYLEGTVDETKAALNVVRDSAVAMGMVGEGRINISAERGYYSDDYEVNVIYYFTRCENTEERETREAAEARTKAAAKAKRKAAAENKRLQNDDEYAEFLRLKEKFAVTEKIA